MESHIAFIYKIIKKGNNKMKQDQHNEIYCKTVIVMEIVTLAFIIMLIYKLMQ
jgi:hypothetical protein